MKRTGKIYNVQLAKYAWIPVEADSPQKAMELAKRFVDDIDDEKFEDSDVEVEACESYSRDPEDFEDEEYIYTADGEFTYDDYLDALE